jgi:peroxiredoxin
VLGVSTDDHGTQCRFAEQMQTPFPLIADHDRSIAKAYGVLWPIFGLSRRVTFVLARDRRVLAVFHHELRVKHIRDQVLRFVYELRRHAS